MKILLAIDPSSASQVAVDEAAARPWPKATEFAVIHVVDLTMSTRVPALIEDDKHSAEIVVKDAADKLARAGYQVTSEVFIGYPRRAVPDYAKDWGADWVMVGSHGQGAIRRFLVGSVAQAALRRAPCSVAIVRGSAPPKDTPPGAKKILVATDGSECAVAAVNSVASRPWPAGTETKVVSVVQIMTPEDDLSTTSLGSVYPASLVEDLINDAQARAKDAVASARKILEAAGLKVDDKDGTPVGDPRDVLLDRAKDYGANLIVLGTHGWSGVDRFLIGSVSESVAFHAHCSVEVVRMR